jgi:hypothetical protein
MGQYYIVIFLAEKDTVEKEYIRLYIESHIYDSGNKLMEHSYLENTMMKSVETLLCPEGIFYKSRVVWAGDYADSEEGIDDNLYLMTAYVENANKYLKARPTLTENYYRYIVNHTKKQYVDKEKCKRSDDGNVVHPLALLTNESNGRGGGDYRGTNEVLCGTWARDTISVENAIPDCFTELVCDFEEYY